jgi:hypothetical protein
MMRGARTLAGGADAALAAGASGMGEYSFIVLTGHDDVWT